MIVVRLEKLPDQLQDDLHRLFQSPGYAVLVQVAEAQVKLHQAKALELATTAAKGSPLKIEASEVNILAAAKYSSFLDTLAIIKETKSYVNVKLT